MSNNTATMDLASAERGKLSKTFFVFAWAIEFAAAGVGIIIAINRLTGRDGELQLSDAFVDALPFFAVAIMELTKIPLCTVIYHTLNKRWRFAFTIGLLLSMFITFETFYMGFEQYQAKIERKIQPVITQIENIRLKIEIAGKNLTASQNEAGQKGVFTQQHKERLDTINSQYDEKIKSINERKNSINEKYGGSRKAVEIGINSINDDIKNLRDRLKDLDETETKRLETLTASTQQDAQKLRVALENDIKGLNAEKNNIRASADQNKEKIRDESQANFKECAYNCDERFIEPANKKIADIDGKTQERIANIDNKIEDLRQEMAQPGSKQARQRESDIRKDFSNQRKQIQEQLVDLTAKQEKKTAALALLGAKKSRKDKDALEALTKERNAAAEEAKKQREEANKEFNRNNKQVSTAQQDASDTRGNLQTLNNDLVEPCNEYNTMVADEQVFRLAMQLHGVDKACDLTQEQLSLTQLLWFGSLALVTSALGTTLAFAGLVIKYPPSLPSGGGIGGAVKGLFRRVNYALALLHRRLRKPKIKEVPVEKEVIKEVTKEVPVDKVVFRDVPREVVKRELVHVPLFTQDVKAVVKDD